VERPVVTQNFNHHQMTKVKSQKPIIKVVHYMLIEKWIFVKRDKQLSAFGRGGKIIGDSEIASRVVGSSRFTVCHVCLVFQLWLSYFALFHHLELGDIHRLGLTFLLG
jgi:hypothetical protein